jgi:hypothetical protein
LNKLNVEDLIKYAFDETLIEKETLEEFASNLYSYRNSIVHSKKEAKNVFLIPSPLSTGEKEKWLHVLEKLSRHCINHFCN